MKILAVIPARSGSKSVKNKNIREINGIPMLAYSIIHAKESKLINRIILDTDSEEYAEIGRNYGAQTPYIRPAEYATDTATDLQVFKHCLTWLKENEDYVPDIVVQLRPTCPLRNPKDIDNMIEMLISDETADSVRSMAPAREIAYKMWRKAGDGSIEPLLTDIPEAYNKPRQELPTIYYQNACIDVTRPATIIDKNSMTGSRILGYEMKENYDIDTEQELILTGLHMGGKRLVFDIDGVIAKLRTDNNYALSEPDRGMIDTVNRLYDEGNQIVLFTARGYKTGIDWQEVTREQLAKWNVKYHELHFGKPNADYYIDDRMLNMRTLRNGD